MVCVVLEVCTVFSVLIAQLLFTSFTAFTGFPVYMYARRGEATLLCRTERLVSSGGRKHHEHNSVARMEVVANT